jgi:outer membrane protein with beta-barrel domain
MRIFATALLVLGSVCVAQAQETAPAEASGNANVIAILAADSASRMTPLRSRNDNSVFFLSSAKPMNTLKAPVVTTALAVPLETAEPAAPSPKPKFLYSRDERDRWELGLGITWIRFRSSIFNASAVGLKTSVTYNTNEWFGIEGNVSAAFAPEIFDRTHVKLLVYGAGPKIAWHRYKRWDPWLHGIFGGAHEQPQTAGNNSKSTYSIQLGGGADYNFNYRFSGRLEGDFVQTGFFGQNQNNFQLTGGVVLHF